MTHRLLRGLTALLLIGIAACRDSLPTAVAPKASASSRAAADLADARDSTAALLARGIALAMADPSVRRQVFEDLRDSPFPYHTIHATSYLHGRRGRAIADAAAQALKVSSEQYLQLVRSTPALALGVGSAIDRLTWTGTEDIVVAATALSPAQAPSRVALVGYGVSGSKIAIPLRAKAHVPVLLLSPVPFAFPADPERRRAAAPHHNRTTISSPQVEQAAIQSSTAECSPDLPYNEWVACMCVNDPNSLPECQEAPQPPPSSMAQADVGPECGNGFYAVVNPGNDRDSDGIRDACEQLFAKRFEPSLLFHHTETVAGREPHYTVQLVNGYVAIGYLLSYYYDGGAVSHQGDSEFIIIRLESAGGSVMRVVNITTSAHWGATAGWWFDETRTYGPDAFQFAYDGYSAYPHPFIFVSRNHHGNYNTEYRCDQRTGDECDNFPYARVEKLGRITATGSDGLRLDNNIGSAARPFDIDPSFAGPPDCTTAEIGYIGQVQERRGVECFRFESPSVSKFAGWHVNNEAGTTHYRHALLTFGLW